MSQQNGCKVRDSLCDETTELDLARNKRNETKAERVLCYYIASRIFERCGLSSLFVLAKDACQAGTQKMEEVKVGTRLDRPSHQPDVDVVILLARRR